MTHDIPWPSILETLSLLPAQVLLHLNHLRTRRSSSILLLFWPLYVLAVTLWTRTVASAGLTDADEVSLGFRWTVVGVGLIVFVLECKGSESYSELPKEASRPENPIVTANIFQRYAPFHDIMRIISLPFNSWNFAWLTPMMTKGAKTYLEEEDLPVLPVQEHSSQLGAELHQAWEK
jgi:ATP-binding cassette subfamily C (CFTR/MRP) protein 1